ncbi:MAG: hypothetical protein ACHQTE_01730 [Candidatus Saccharimonadales bacterium]
MIELAYLQQQDDFPADDITQNNADILKAMLSDPGIAGYAHETVERSMTLYRISHLVLRELLGSTEDFNERGAEWFNGGIVQYEVAASLLRSHVVATPLYFNNIVPVQYMSALLKANDQANYFDRAHSDLLNKQPNLCDVIEEVTKRTISPQRSAVEHALFGAAVQRQIEIDAIYDTEQHIMRAISDDLE